MTSSSDPTVAQANGNSDFSIEHILTKAGNRNAHKNITLHQGLTTFPWLQCTRYCPPKLPRSQKKEGPQKRQLGRHPRIPFSGQQLAVLEEKFKNSPYLSSTEVTQLSRKLQLADIRVKIWFQNRRARERRERNEEPKPLKSQSHDTNVPCSPKSCETPLSFTHTNVHSSSQSNESFPEPSNSPTILHTSQKHLDFKNILYFFDPNHP
ncbi:uncharacterized protein CBL_03863 [Carabus blaptoides fortunei]